jgi:hypothetical protein
VEAVSALKAVGRWCLQANRDVWDGVRYGVQDWRVWLALAYAGLLIWIAATH